MVRQVMRKTIFAAIILSVLCTPIAAATHSVYTEGNMSTTYLTYFKDIVSGIGFNENYVAFRSGQYEYTMCVGKLVISGEVITLDGDGKLYTFTNSGNYNSIYNYNVTETNNFSVEVGDSIIYSDVGDFPQLVERGAQIETITLTLLGIVCVYYLVSRIFSHS